MSTPPVPRACYPEDPFPLLREGRIEHVELIPWGSNYTFAVVLKGPGEESCLAVYKPRRGEVPLRDFPGGTLYKREVAAYRFAVALGWPIVPPTIVRHEAPHGVGSLQLYVEPAADSSSHFDNIQKTHSAELQRMALFDILINNADRKGGHCLLDVRNKVWGIDHGLTFHPGPKMRTVIWDFCGEAIPPELIGPLATMRADETRCQTLRDDLGELLSPVEIDALFKRWDGVLSNPCYPVLDLYRNVPWPPF